MHGCQRSMCAASEFACYLYVCICGCFVKHYMYAFVVLQVALLALLTSATAGVAFLALLTSHCKATQCMSILEVIKLSAWGRKLR